MEDTVRQPPMDPDTVLGVFRQAGALLEGHFQLSSGRHSSGYLQCALVLQQPARAEALGAALGSGAAAWRPAAVLSPALGAGATRNTKRPRRECQDEAQNDS